MSNSSSTAAKLCQTQVVQMRQRLPIMQMQMRVDQIQHRLDTIHNSARKLATSASTPRLQQNNTEREGQLLSELTSIQAALGEALAKYQKDHGELFPQQYKLVSPLKKRESPANILHQGDARSAIKSY